MTCVAWDGKALAADRQSNSSGMRHAATKIERFGNLLLGITGDYGTAAEMRQWFKSGALPTEFPTKARDDVSTLIVVGGEFDGGVRYYCASPYPQVIEGARHAWGCGRDFALAAMHCGKTAAEAVEIASVYDIHCGMGVDTLTLEGRA